MTKRDKLITACVGVLLALVFAGLYLLLAAAAPSYQALLAEPK